MENNKIDIFDRIMMLPGLRVFNGFYKKNKSVLLYLFFGVLTTAVSIGSFVIAENVLALNELIANIFSWICAVSFAYVTNRIWVFHSDKKGKEIWNETISFFTGRLFTLAVEEVMLLVFVTVLGLQSIVIKVAAQFVVLILNYFISKLIVFRGHKDKC